MQPDLASQESTPRQFKLMNFSSSPCLSVNINLKLETLKDFSGFALAFHGSLRGCQGPGGLCGLLGLDVRLGGLTFLRFVLNKEVYQNSRAGVSTKVFLLRGWDAAARGENLMLSGLCSGRDG